MKARIIESSEMGKLILYHGSNVTVTIPKVLQSDRKLDFGTGFYLTSDLNQAQRWAKLATERRQAGEPLVSVYEIDENKFEALKLKRFFHADAEWLKFISANRNGTSVEGDFDVIIGPVANDKTMPSIRLYLMGIYDEDETIKRLKPQKLKDQYAFKTKKAVSLLHFKESIKHE